MTPYDQKATLSLQDVLSHRIIQVAMQAAFVYISLHVSSFFQLFSEIVDVF